MKKGNHRCNGLGADRKDHDVEAVVIPWAFRIVQSQIFPLSRPIISEAPLFWHTEIRLWLEDPN